MSKLAQRVALEAAIRRCEDLIRHFSDSNHLKKQESIDHQLEIKEELVDELLRLSIDDEFDIVTVTGDDDGHVKFVSPNADTTRPVRKIIQIMADPTDHIHSEIIGLCDDGTVWVYINDLEGNQEWVRLVNIPQGDVN